MLCGKPQNRRICHSHILKFSPFLFWTLGNSLFYFTGVIFDSFFAFWMRKLACASAYSMSHKLWFEKAYPDIICQKKYLENLTPIFKSLTEEDTELYEKFLPHEAWCECSCPVFTQLFCCFEFSYSSVISFQNFVSKTCCFMKNPKEMEVKTGSSSQVWKFNSSMILRLKSDNHRYCETAEKAISRFPPFSAGWAAKKI